VEKGSERAQAQSQRNGIGIETEIGREMEVLTSPLKMSYLKYCPEETKGAEVIRNQSPQVLTFLKVSGIGKNIHM
jgi:hypothetical protein